MSRSRGNRGKKSPSPGGGPAITLGSLTHVGKVRTSNQDDYCAVLDLNAPPGTDALLAVADGMGGHQAGDVASKLAIRGLVQRLAPSEGGEPTLLSQARYDTRLEQVVQQVNAEVSQEALRPETYGMGSTLTVAVIAGTSLTVAQVGDSRAYLLRQGQLRQLTQDHSWVAEQVAQGMLTPQEAREHPRRNILTRALGTAPQVEVDTLVFPLEEGDVLMLCSDGLHGLVTDEELARVLGHEAPQAAAQTLVDQANALGGHDNITVVIARVERLAPLGAPPSTQRDRSRETTVDLGTRPAKAKGGGLWRWLRLALKLLLFPLRVSWWLLRVLVRRRR